MSEQKNWTSILPEVEHCRMEMHQRIDDAFNNFLLAVTVQEANALCEELEEQHEPGMVM